MASLSRTREYLRLTEELVVDAVLERVERGVPLELSLGDRCVDHDDECMEP